MNPNEQLDVVLEWFATNLMAAGGVTDDEAYRRVASKETWLSMGLLMEILDVLVSDKNLVVEMRFIYNDLEEAMPWKIAHYKITFKGRVFNGVGGYRQQEADRQAKNTRLERVERAQRFQSGILVAVTCLAAFGSVSEALFAGLNYFEIGAVVNLSAALIASLAFGIALLIAILLWLEVQRKLRQ